MDQYAVNWLNKRLSLRYTKEKLEHKMADFNNRFFNKNLIVEREFFIHKYNIEYIIRPRNMKMYDEVSALLSRNLHKEY